MNEPKTISELMTLVMEESKKGNTNNAIIYLNEASYKNFKCYIKRF